MAAFLFLDEHAARSDAFAVRLNDPKVKIVIADVYFAEFSRDNPDRVHRHMVRLGEFGDRVYCARSASECLKRELASLKRTNRDHVLNPEARQWVLENLTMPRPLAEQITESNVRKTVVAERYSSPENRERYRNLVRLCEVALNKANHKAPAETPLNDAILKNIVRFGRYCVFEYLKEKGHAETEARRFSMKDSFMFRDACARLCRAMDWAQSRGITGQKDRQLDGENMDLEYIVIASYFSEFLTTDQRNQRNAANLHSLLRLAKNVHNMSDPKQAQNP